MNIYLYWYMDVHICSICIHIYIYIYVRIACCLLPFAICLLLIVLTAALTSLAEWPEHASLAATPGSLHQPHTLRDRCLKLWATCNGRKAIMHIICVYIYTYTYIYTYMYVYIFYICTCIWIYYILQKCTHGAGSFIIIFRNFSEIPIGGQVCMRIWIRTRLWLVMHFSEPEFVDFWNLHLWII